MAWQAGIPHSEEHIRKLVESRARTHQRKCKRQELADKVLIAADALWIARKNGIANVAPIENNLFIRLRQLAAFDKSE